MILNQKQPKDGKECPTEKIILESAASETLVTLAHTINEIYDASGLPNEGTNSSILAECVRTQQIDLANSIIARSTKDGSVVGLALFARRGHKGCLVEFGVVPAWRRHGHGERILAGLLTACRRVGVTQVQLVTLYDNTIAQSLYRRFGFQTTKYLVNLRWHRWKPNLVQHHVPLALNKIEEIEAIRLFLNESPEAIWDRQLQALLSYQSTAIAVKNRHGVRTWMWFGEGFRDTSRGEGNAHMYHLGVSSHTQVNDIISLVLFILNLNRSTTIIVGGEPVSSNTHHLLVAAGFTEFGSAMEMMLSI